MNFWGALMWYLRYSIYLDEGANAANGDAALSGRAGNLLRALHLPIGRRQHGVPPDPRSHVGRLWRADLLNRGGTADTHPELRPGRRRSGEILIN